ncbi:MAG: Ig domain-containing protein [Myxococcaceae bacterium]|nr:Ig domain-containing protein [Myxococcaceae bacterium]
MRVAWLSVLVSTVAAAQGLLVLEPDPATAPAGSASRPLTLRRLAPDGGAAPAPLTPWSVQLTARTSQGALALSPSASAPWASQLTVTFADGSAVSAPFHYRDPIPGDAGLDADGGPQWNSALRLTVSPLSLGADLEDGTLTDDESPRGPFSGRIPNAPNTMSATPAAAHRGAWGVRFTDLDPASGSGSQGALAHDTAPMRGNYFVRTWLRLVPVTPTGSFEVLAIKSPQTDLELLYVSYPSGGLYVGGYTASSQYAGDPTDGGLVSGQWHLVELGLMGIGTANGTRLAWLDGSNIVDAGIDFRGPVDRVTELAVGQPWADDRGYVGALDFDDTRVSTEPHASTLAVTGPASVEVGSCTQLTVALRTSDGANAPAPYSVDVQVGAASGEATVHSESSCARPGGGLTLAPGSSSATLWVRARTAGTLTLRAVHPDFLSRAWSMTATPGPLRLVPASAQVRAGERLDFEAFGGTGPYAFAATAASGGTISDAGVYRAGADGGLDLVRVTDAKGAMASAEVTVTAGPARPRFTAPPTQQLECEQPYTSSPRVEGDGPLAFTGKGLPSGLTLDQASGALSWTPSKAQAGRWPLSLSVAGPGGTDAMDFELSVRCPALERGCGCGTSPAAALLAPALLAWWRRRRRG